MSMLRKRTRRTVRPHPPWRAGKRLYGLVFVTIGGLVYWLGQATAERPGPIAAQTSTATVYQQSESPTVYPNGDQATPTYPAASNAEAIEQQITSDTNLRRAVQQMAPSTVRPPDEHSAMVSDRDIEPIRSSLEVSVAATAQPGEFAVAISFTDYDPEYTDPDYAVRLVNTLAENYADDYRESWKRRTYRAYAEVQEVADRAKAEWLSAETRLGEFLESHFQRQTSATEELEQAAGLSEGELDGDGNTDEPAPVSAPPVSETGPQPSRQSRPATPVAPSTSRAAALRKGLAKLELLRKSLLVERTPAHPEVQQIEDQIAEITRKLEAVAEEPPGVTAERPTDDPRIPPANRPPTPLQSARIESAKIASKEITRLGTEAARQFTQLKAAADRTAVAHDRAADVALMAWKAQTIEPKIEMDLARPTTTRHLTPPMAEAELLWVALAVGLAAAMGVGMVVTGAAIEPTLSSVAQAEAVLPIPVVGRIPENDPTGRPSALGGRQSLIRRTMIFGGLVLIAGCGGVLIGALGGF